jgi:hypothetical protein
MISQYFTRAGFCLFCSPHGNDKGTCMRVPREQLALRRAKGLVAAEPGAGAVAGHDSEMINVVRH